MPCCPSRPRLSLILFSLVLACARFAQAALDPGGGPEIRTLITIPMNQFRWNAWREVVVGLDNKGPTPYDARLVLQFPEAEDSEGLQQFSRTVHLPPQSRQEIKLLVKFPKSARLKNAKFQGLAIRARLMKDQITLSENSFYALMPTQEDLTLLWGDTHSSTLLYKVRKYEEEQAQTVWDKGIKGVKSKPVPALPGPKRRDFAIHFLRSKDLPHRMQGYDGYKLVVLSAWDEQDRPDALQVESLLNWVRSGGQLLVIAGPHLLNNPIPDLAALLPLWPSETYRVSTLPELETRFGNMDILPGMDLYDGPRAPCTILLGNEDQPILLRRPLDSGNILFLALDIDRMQDHPSVGMVRFVQTVIALSAEATHPLDFPDDSTTRDILEQLISIKILSKRAMVLYMGAYLFVILATLIGARFTRRPEWAWPLIAIVSMGFFLLFQRQGEASLNARDTSRIERVQIYLASLPEGSSTARFSGIQGFFPSATRAIRFFMESFNASVFGLTSSRIVKDEVLDLQTLDTEGIRQWQIAANTLRATGFEGLHAFEKPALQGSMRLTRDGPLLEVTSSFPWPLDESFLHWNRLVAPLPPLAPGKTMRIETWKDKALWGRYSSSDLQEGSGAAARTLLRRLVFPELMRHMAAISNLQEYTRKINHTSSQATVIGGFTSQDPAFWKTESRETSATLGLWLVSLPPASLQCDPEFWLPPGMAELQFPDKITRTCYLGGGNFAGSKDNVLVLRFNLPPLLRTSIPREILIHGQFESLQFSSKTEAALGPPDKEPSTWTLLPSRLPAPLPLSGGPLDSQHNTLWIRISISSGRPSQSSSPSISQSWSLEGLDVSLRGTLPTATPPVP